MEPSHVTHLHFSPSSSLPGDLTNQGRGAQRHRRRRGGNRRFSPLSVSAALGSRWSGFVCPSAQRRKVNRSQEFSPVSVLRNDRIKRSHREKQQSLPKLVPSPAARFAALGAALSGARRHSTSVPRIHSCAYCFFLP